MNIVMTNGEETRKIQFTGKSTYIISLPKQWITDLGLKQGDQVTIGRKGISSLLITPYHTRRKDESEIATLEIEPKEETSSVVRKLVSLYFFRFKTINIKPKTGRITPSQRIGIRDAVKKILMGSEITADSSDGITIQVLINLVELSVDGAFKRMMLLAKSMQDDALLAIKEGNEELAKEVINSDDDVDRFAFYITRQLVIAIENEYMLKEMGFDKIQEMSIFAISVIDDACLALFKKDYEQAENAIKKSSRIIKYEKNIVESLKTNNDELEAFRIRRIVENVKRIAEYASDIGEIVLNMNIEKILKKPMT